MKLKELPEDFIVREKSKIPIRNSGSYSIYLLEKREQNTMDVIQEISRKLKIPLRNISYGGKKDRYAITSQFISIKGNALPDEFEGNGYRLKFIGFSDTPMKASFIEGNDFTVTIRDLKDDEIKRVLSEIEFVKSNGFVNYFDDQRFGSYSPELGFIGEKIIKGHYNGAVKIYLTAVHHGGGNDEIERRRYFYKNWGDWDACMKKAKTRFEREAFRILKARKRKGYVEVLNMIPKEELSLFFSAYQSYLWNRVAEEVVKIMSDELLLAKGLYWGYLFYRKVRDLDYIRELHIPTASSRVKMPDSLTSEIFNRILKERGIKVSDFNLKRFRKAFFKTNLRRFAVFPDLKDVRVESDDLYAGRKKLIINFFLPRGSYGTMFIKRIFAEPCKHHSS